MSIIPDKTSALIVGIEHYQAPWDLNGPAHDAAQFANWLHNRQVPIDNLALFISPLEKNSDLSLPTGLQYKSATEQNIRNFIEDRLRYKNETELFYLYWGGHGVITTEGERRFFYADADTENLKNLDFNKLLAFLRTDYFPSTLSRQICLVDTCANYTVGLNNQLPDKDFPMPVNKPAISREQFILMAAKPGELAKNLDTESTGLFTKELMTQLAKQSENEWPPNMEIVKKQLKQRFEALREAGQSEQTPTYSFYRDGDFNEETLGKVPTREYDINFLAIDLTRLSDEQKSAIISKLNERAIPAFYINSKLIKRFI